MPFLTYFFSVLTIVNTSEKLRSVRNSVVSKNRAKALLTFACGRKCMEKQLRKAKDRCFLYAIGVFFLACWVILKLHGYLSGLGYEDRSTPMLFIDSMLYFMLFFAVMTVRPVSSYLFSLYCKRLQKKTETTESAAQGG